MIIMKINISPEAETILQKEIKSNNIVLLTLNDGVNKYSNVGSCTSVLAFQLVIVDKKDPIYQIKLENNYGIYLFTGEREASMLATGLKLKSKNNVLSLVSDEGVVDDAITVNNLTQDKQSFVLNKI